MWLSTIDFQVIQVKSNDARRTPLWSDPATRPPAPVILLEQISRGRENEGTSGNHAPMATTCGQSLPRLRQARPLLILCTFLRTWYWQSKSQPIATWDVGILVDRYMIYVCKYVFVCIILWTFALVFQPFIACFARPTYSAPHWTSPTQALRCVIGHIQGVLTEVLELGTLSTDQVSFKICRSESLLYACGAVTVIPSTDFQCNHSTVKHACVLNSSRKLKLPWPRAQQETPM